MCMTEIEKSRFIDRQTIGDKLNETGRQTRKLQNGQHEYLNIIKFLHTFKYIHVL
jgi:hypothetical protein